MRNVIWILCIILLASVKSSDVVYVYPEISPAKPYYFNKYNNIPTKSHVSLFEIREHPYLLRKKFQRKTSQNRGNISKSLQNELADVSELESKLKSLLEVEKILKTLISNEKKVVEAEEYAKDSSLNEDTMEKEQAELEEHKLEADVEKNEKQLKENTLEEKREEEDEALEGEEEEQADKEFMNDLKENAMEKAKENMEKTVLQKDQVEAKKYLDEVAKEVAMKEAEKEKNRRIHSSLESQLHKNSLKEEEEMAGEVTQQSEKKRHKIQQILKEKMEREAQDVASLDQSKQSAKGSCMSKQEAQALNQYINVHSFLTNGQQNNTLLTPFISEETRLKQFNENEIFHHPTDHAGLSAIQWCYFLCCVPLGVVSSSFLLLFFI